MQKTNVKSISFSYKIFSIFNTLILLFISFATLYPFAYVFFRSFTKEQVIYSRGLFLIPRSPTFEAYKYILGPDSPILSGYMNTIFVTIVGTAVSLTITSMMAYALSKKYLPGRKVVTFLVFLTMLFGGGLIPTFLVVKATGLLDSLWAIIIPSAVSAWNTFLLRNFFMAIPESLEDSARIDGCNEIGILFRIIIPLSMAALSTIGLFYAVGKWNNWTAALFYISDRRKWPVQNILRDILNSVKIFEAFMEDQDSYEPPPALNIRTASIIVSSLPILLVYPFVQKYFVKGVMVGSIKG